MGASSLRVGTVGYSCQSGLGILTKAFWDHGIVNQMFIVEHSRHPTEWQWYPQTIPHCPIRELDQNSRELRRFVDGLDVLLCFETPFLWDLVNYAKGKGIKTVCMTMYECSHQNPPATFDEYWCPSLLDLNYFVSGISSNGGSLTPFEPCDGVYNSIARFTPVPVQVDWRQRTEARVFVHNAGHGGLKGRNGTRDLVDALPLVKSPATFLIHSQEHQADVEESLAKISSTVDVHYSSGTRASEDLYTEGDVFIFPEKFNGLSLPLQEARAAGMLVMATDRYPMNTWLPSKESGELICPTCRSSLIFPMVDRGVQTRRCQACESVFDVSDAPRECPSPLIPTVTTVKNRIGPPYMEFDEAVIDPKAIAAKIDEWYGRDLTQYSLSGKEWAETMSWDVLGPKYLQLLKGLK